MDVGEIIAGGIAAGMSLLLWWLNTVSQKTKNSSEIERNDAEIDNLESTIIQNLVKALSEMQESHHELIENHGTAVRENLVLINKLSSKDRELDNIKSEYERLLEQNGDMLQQSDVLKNTIKELERIVIEEQMDKQRFRAGTRKLVRQLEKAGLIPVFDLNEAED